MLNLGKIESERQALGQKAKAVLATLDAERTRLLSIIELCSANGGPKAPVRVATKGKKKVGSITGARVDWDGSILAKLPKRFTVGEAAELAAKLGVPRNQVYPALDRWKAAKKVRRYLPGKYEKK